MTDPTSESPNPNPVPTETRPKSGPELAASLDLLLISYIAYALSFFTGFSALVGLIIAYVKRPEVVGTWRESHYTWLIRTFWIGLVGAFISSILIFVAIGVLLMGLLAIWLVIRLVKGWMAYSKEQPIADPESYLFG